MPRKRAKLTAELAIESLSHEGRGVARREGKTVFVHGALPGERVVAERYKSRPKFEEAKVLEIKSAVPARVEPVCRHYEVCGGCSLQHLSTHDQIEHKQRVLLELIQHQAAVAPEFVKPPVMAASHGYRRKARLGVKHVIKKERVLVGFRERNKPYVADIESCTVLDARVGERLMDLAALVESLSAPNKIPQIEVAMGDDCGALVFRNLVPLTEDDRIKLANFGERVQLSMFLQPGGEDSLQAVFDAGELTYSVDDGAVTFAFEPLDFTQVNAEINQQLIPEVCDLLDLQPEDKVIDFFCGLGNFTLPMARRTRTVLGIEGETSLIDRAKQNASRNDIHNVDFECADLSDTEFFARKALLGYNKILIDPPRTGAAALFTTMDLTGVERIAYVSCNPATLARDIGFAVENHGFTLQYARVFDMFPHTAHVESAALLVRKT